MKKLNIDRYKQADGSYKMYTLNGDYQGMSYTEPEAFIQEEILKFCGCGCAEDNLMYIRDVLEHINTRYVEPKITYEQWKENAKKIFSSSGQEYFIYYFLAREGFTEHGGSVPGWLSVEGSELLEDLNTIFPKTQNETTNQISPVLPEQNAVAQG